MGKAGLKSIASEAVGLCRELVDRNKEWASIHGYVVKAADRFDAGRYGMVPTEWPDEDMAEMVKVALEYWLQHVERFGIDKNGWPQSERCYRSTVESMRTALEHVAQAYQADRPAASSRSGWFGTGRRRRTEPWIKG